MLNIGSIALLFSALVNGVLGVLVLIRKHKAIPNIAFFAITALISLWLVSIVILNEYSFADGLLYILVVITYISALGIPLAFLFFVNSFGFKYMHNNILIGVASVVTAITIVITLIPGLVIDYVNNTNGALYIEFGPLYILFGSVVISIFFISFYLLLLRYKISYGKLKLQILYILIGTSISTVISLITNLILPFWGVFSLFSVAPSIISVMSLFVGYAIVKHGLWNFKKVLVEMASIILIVLSVVNFFIDDSYVGTVATIVFKSIDIVVTYIIVRILLSVFKKVQNQKIKLKKINKRLIEMDKKKTEFLHIATHQLRGPVTSINGYASLIKNGDFGSLTKEQKHVLQKIIDSGKMMTDIINDYMDIARIEENNLILHKEYFYLCELVQERAEMLRTSAEKKGLRLVMKNVSGKICKVYADKKSISQVINSLLENAIKYTIKGEVTVYTEKSDDGKRAMVHISDSGIGIPKDEIDNIFVKFSRASNAKQSSVGGTGMGLFIAKSLIELNGGTISVHSDGLNKGTTFTIELPLVNG